MKRFLALFLIPIMWVILGGWYMPGWKQDNRWSDNLYFYSTVIASGHKAGVTTNVSTETTLNSAALAYGVINMEIGSAKTIGLDNGVPGQMITIICSVRDGANLVISKPLFPVTTHSTGWSTLTFDNQGDSITLLFMDGTVGWIVSGNNGVVITQ